MEESQLLKMTPRFDNSGKGTLRTSGKRGPSAVRQKALDRETEFYYYGARCYEPRLARWMSVDPAGFELVSPMERDGQGGLRPRQGFNLIESVNHYLYAGNNPIKYVDPTGEERWSAFFLEPSVSIIASLGSGANSLKFGRDYSNVTFINLETGRSFTREYTFKITNVTGDSESPLNSGMLSAGLTLEAGMVIADFDEPKNQDEVADKFPGEFFADTVTAGPGMLSKISSEDWDGGSFGLTEGKGLGYAEIESSYNYLGNEDKKGQRNGLVGLLRNLFKGSNTDE